MRPIFADPKTDFIFKRIFGSEHHKHLLIELLNTLLELEGDRRISNLTYLPAEKMVPLPEMKLSIVDVKCVDERGREYVVEMQLFNVQGFEERVVYNASKAFVMQLRSSEDYPHLADVVGVTICDFALWTEPDAAEVPMISRWRMQEQHSGANGLGQVQYVFLELPKHQGGAHPRTLLDKWAYFFRDAENLDVIPPELDEAPFREAFEVARMAGMSEAEHEAYERAKMAEQDARGALEKAEEKGMAQGMDEGRRKELRRSLADVCELLGIELPDERHGARHDVVRRLAAVDVVVGVDRLFRAELAAGERPELGVGQRGGLLHQAEGADEGTRETVAADREVTERPLTVCQGLQASGLEGPCRIDPGFAVPDLNDRVRPRTPCNETANAICLGGRFLVEVEWEVDGDTGPGRVTDLRTEDTGSFYFFSPDNVELMVKALDGRRTNGHYWVFYGSLTNVGFDLVVTDTETGRESAYSNAPGNFASVGDTAAF